MTGIRFADVQGRPAEFLNLTSLTLEEFEVLVEPFEAAFQDHMAAWRLDGKPRTARRFTVYRTCPLATPEDRLFFLLTYLKTYAVQVVQGRLFGMSQSKATPAPSRLWRTGWLSWRRRSRRWRSLRPPQSLHPKLGRAPPLYGAFDVKRFPIQPLFCLSLCSIEGTIPPPRPWR